MPARRPLATELRIAAFLQLVVTLATLSLALYSGIGPAFALLAGAAAGFGVWLVQSTALLAPLERTLRALRDGVRGFEDNDFSLRLAVTRRDEIGELVELHNRIATALHQERHELYQRELLLDTILRSNPSAILLTSQNTRVVYANRAARELFVGGGKLDGVRLTDLLRRCPEQMRDALTASESTLFSVGSGANVETYQSARRSFQLNGQIHDLYVIERLTQELRRREVEIWKNAIRVLNHELNNSLAPIRSLAHSARTVLSRPEHLHRLEDILGTIEERVLHLSEFLEGYARFARLPPPQKQLVPWREFLEGLREVYVFHIEGDLPETPGWFDRAQLQQALINLLKNATESGSLAEDIKVTVRPGPGGSVSLCVFDRGAGMSESVIEQALLPFFTAKPGGTGLGLPLCNEILEAHGGSLKLRLRATGGTQVTCVLPGP